VVLASPGTDILKKLNSVPELAKPNLQANPTIASCNASSIKINSATNSKARFWNESYFAVM
jgi:hypothetical protein